MSLTEIGKKILDMPNVISRKPVFEKYDKNVQGNTVLERGQAEASVITPFLDFSELPENKASFGVASAIAGNPLYGKISALSQGKNAVAESVMKIYATGSKPLGITDCLNFANPEKKEQMGDFVSGVKGVSEAANTLGIPVISGNVSFYNESENGAIPPSVTILSVGKIENSKDAILNFSAEEGLEILLVGERKNELGGSVFYDLLDKTGSKTPEPDFKKIKEMGESIISCAKKNLVASSCVVSLGGIFVALSGFAIRSKLGVNISLEKIPGEGLKNYQKLFAESFGFLLFVESKSLSELNKIFSEKNIEVSNIGKTGGEKIYFSDNGEKIVEIDLKEVSKTYEEKLLSFF